MGGYNGNFKNDVWSSTDNGISWTQMNPSAGWSARASQSSVVAPGSPNTIILMGGQGSGVYKNDVWSSTDNGASWNVVPPVGLIWTPRASQSTVRMQDGSIILMGGYDGSFRNDTWRSTDNGASWTQMNASAKWSARSGQSSVAMPDGSIILMGGYEGGVSYKNDVWRSTDNGGNWTQIPVSGLSWLARTSHTSVVVPGR